VLREVRPLIFHSHFETFDLSTVLLKLAFYRDCKVVWHFHGMARMTTSQRLKDLFKVRLLARNFGDAFVPVSDGAYRNAVDRGFPRVKIALNQNGIDSARFSPDCGKRLESRLALGASGNETVFLSLGYDPVVKGTDLFVKAAAEMTRSAGRNALFLVIGRKNTRDFISQMREASDLGVTLRILDPTDDFPPLLSGVDVLVAPSRTEGLSYAVLEAMACGKVALCSDIPGVREIYGNVEGVWLFPTEDWKTLAQLMQRARELPPAERECLVQSNSKFVASHYSLEEWAKRMGTTYRNLLQQA
jgi:glycosyltransferase involved in cell wall biosynthesis